MENSNIDRNRSHPKVCDYKINISVQQQTVSTFVHSFDFSEVFERHDIPSGKKINMYYLFTILKVSTNQRYKSNN